MKLLLDANLSWRLARTLKTIFPDTVHVTEVNLPAPAKDSVIWEYAKTHHFIILTNDADFLNFSAVKGWPPKVILLRTGNQTTGYLESLISRHIDTIRSFAVSDTEGVLQFSGNE